MDYIEVRLECLPGFSEILMAELLELGFETFMDTDEGFMAYTEEDQFNEDKLKELVQKYAKASQLNYEIVKIGKKNWNEEWEKNYGPIIIEDKCIVKASFHTLEKRFPYEITINPKMSFGTGHHETTCLMISQQLQLEHGNKTVFDVGSGTGILSILASKLGANIVDACDKDNWSVENSRENFVLNDCHSIHIALGTVRSIKLSRKYDIIIANINRNVLFNEIPIYANLLKGSGHLLISGFYKEDIRDLCTMAKEHKLTKLNEKLKNNWASVLFMKNNE